MKKEVRNFSQNDKALLSKHTELKRKLSEFQRRILNGEADEACLQIEQLTREELYMIVVKEERILKQKSRIQWLQHGDQNFSYFHRITRAKKSKNHIRSLINEHGQVVEDIQQIKNATISYFKKLLGSVDNNVSSSTQ